MFCPECRSEYRPGFTHCPTCNVDLVPQLQDPPAELPLEETDLRTVFVTLNSSEASLVKSLLEGSGLSVALLDDNLSRMDPPAAIMIGGIKVTVPKHEEKLAHEILEEYRGRAGQDPGQGQDNASENEEYRCIRCRNLMESETTVCAKCGAEQFE